MTEVRLRRILEMLNFYSDTFARISLVNMQEVGETAVTLISSILNCPVAAVLIEDEKRRPSLLASHGVNPECLSSWTPGNRFFEFLWRQVDVGTHLMGHMLAPDVAQTALQLGLGDRILVAPLKTIEDDRERHLGYALAARMRDPVGIEDHRLALEVIAGHLTGALVACKANRLLTGINESLLAVLEERHRAQDALRESEERYRQLFERNLAGVYRSTLDGRVLDCNDSFARIFGYSSRAEVINRRAEDLYASAGDRAAFLARLREHGVLTNYEWPMRRKDGNEIWVLENTTLVARVEGQPELLEGSIFDISKRKQAEQALRRAGQYEAIGRLAGGVANDFNNILEIVLGQSELLLASGLLDESLSRRAREIRDAAERAAGLTQKLLAFSGRQAMHPEAVDLNALVEELEPTLRRLLGKRIDLSVNLAPQLDSALVDPAHITEAILALVNNAREASPEGGRVTIATARVQPGSLAPAPHGATRREGYYVLLSVADTGRGIDEALQPVVFEPFFSTKEKPQGAGLGLAAVYGIVAQSGGFIDVESAPGQGATFRLYFPRAPLEKDVALPAVALERLPAAGHTVLVAEDETAVRKLVCEVLKNNGYTVLAACDGTEALQLAESHRDGIHLLCTDLSMPGMSGGELARRLLVTRSGLRILYMSGYTSEGVEDQGPSRPPGVFLQKPFRPSALLQEVREILADSAGRTEAAGC